MQKVHYLYKENSARIYIIEYVENNLFRSIGKSEQ